MKKLHTRKIIRLVLLIMMIFISFRSFSWGAVSELSENDKFYIKKIILSDMYLNTKYITPSDIEYLESNFYNIFVIDSLKSKGFNKVDFFSVHSKIKPDSLVKLFQSVNAQTSTFYNEEFVMNDNNIFLMKQTYVIAKCGGVYKISGFVKDDIFALYSYCYNTSDGFSEEVVKVIEKTSHKNTKGIVHKISQYLYIENIDIANLFQKMTREK